VPSCTFHNHANASDVEYARNIICTCYGVNEVGQKHFFDKAKRSFDHTPKLLFQTFGSIRPVMIDGSVGGIFTTDLERVESVMSACVTGLHFHETGLKLSGWKICLVNLASGQPATDPRSIAWNALVSLFPQMNFVGRKTASPEVFEYAVADLQGGGRVYGMRFYQSYVVYGIHAYDHVNPTSTGCG
jgi:hypothetical protein